MHIFCQLRAPVPEGTEEEHASMCELCLFLSLSSLHVSPLSLSVHLSACLLLSPACLYPSVYLSLVSPSLGTSSVGCEPRYQKGQSKNMPPCVSIASLSSVTRTHTHTHTHTLSLSPTSVVISPQVTSAVSSTCKCCLSSFLSLSYTHTYTHNLLFSATTPLSGPLQNCWTHNNIANLNHISSAFCGCSERGSGCEPDGVPEDQGLLQGLCLSGDRRAVRAHTHVECASWRQSAGSVPWGKRERLKETKRKRECVCAPERLGTACLWDVCHEGSLVGSISCGQKREKGREKKEKQSE